MITKFQVKYIQSLGHKKLRDEEGVFVAEGPKIINELLQASNTAPVAIYGVDAWLVQEEKLLGNIPSNILQGIKDAELERISFLSTPNQVLGVFRKPEFDRPVYKDHITLLLDGIQDPGNMGTIIRIADWYGINTIVAGKESADAFNAKVVQATMASITRVQVIYTDLNEFIASQKDIPVYATTLDGKPLQSIGKIDEGFILVSNESKGIHSSLLDMASHRITIPRKGNAESLNAAVATGIVLSHVVG